MSKRGLPETLRMRHDEHYVEALAASAGAPVGRMISIELLDPNPNQPRQVMGDLSELMASVAEKGIIEPLDRAPARAAGTKLSPASGDIMPPCRWVFARSLSSSARSTTPR